MLEDVGCRYAIVGHSERRRWYHEDDALVARKFAAALAPTSFRCCASGKPWRSVKRGKRSGDRPAARCRDRDARGRRLCTSDSRL